MFISKVFWIQIGRSRKEKYISIRFTKNFDFSQTIFEFFSKVFSIIPDQKAGTLKMSQIHRPMKKREDLVQLLSFSFSHTISMIPEIQLNTREIFLVSGVIFVQHFLPDLSLPRVVVFLNWVYRM